MQRLGTDFCASGVVTFTSILSLPWKTAHLEPGRDSEWTSPECGLGWRFESRFLQISIRGLSKKEMRRARITTTNVCRMTFDPYHCPNDFTEFNISLSLHRDQEDLSQPKPDPTASSSDWLRLCDTSIQRTALHQGTTFLGDWPAGEIEGFNCLKATVTAKTPLVPEYSASIPPHVKEVLQKSLDQPQFADVKFCLYTCRSKAGCVYDPRPIYVNKGMCIAKSEYLMQLLSDSPFQEGEFREMTSKPSQEEMPEILDKFDYDSDSDLDDDDMSLTEGTSLGSVIAAKTTPAEASDLPVVLENPPSRALGPSGRGQVIPLKGFAYATWKAYIYYLYTGSITYGPLASQQMGRVSELLNESPEDNLSRGEPCSAKSMYRLAAITEESELRTSALNALKSKLSEANIVEELFTKFTSWYHDVRDMEVELYLKYSKSPAVQTAFREKMQMVCRGELIHAFEAVTAVYARLQGEGPVGTDT